MPFACTVLTWPPASLWTSAPLLVCVTCSAGLVLRPTEVGPFPTDVGAFVVGPACVEPVLAPPARAGGDAGWAPGLLVPPVVVERAAVPAGLAPPEAGAAGFAGADGLGAAAGLADAAGLAGAADFAGAAGLAGGVEGFACKTPPATHNKVARATLVELRTTLLRNRSVF